MARFRPDSRDIARYMRRRMTHSLRTAAFWFAVPLGGVLLYRDSDPLFASACGGFAAAVAFMTAFTMYRWRRAARRYATHHREPIEYLFDADGIRTRSEFGEAFYKRVAIRSVRETGGTFEILLRWTQQPLIMPSRHLDETEIATLRAWAAGREKPNAVPYRAP